MSKVLSLLCLLVLTMPAKGADIHYVPGEVIVKFDNDPAIDLLDAYNLEIVEHLSMIDAYLVRGDEDMDLEKVIDRISHDGKVRYIEPNYIYSLSTKPNDPKFDEMWALNNTGQTGGKQNADIKALEAWQITNDASNVLVAIIDTGIDCTHPDLAANCWKNPGETGKDAQGKDKASNGVDDDNNGYVDDGRGWDFVNNDSDPMDDNKHGTHVAGTIAAIGNNKEGVTGIAWKGNLVGLKFLSGSGSGTLANAVKAISYAVALKAKVMNNSWGGGGFSQSMLDAILQANEKGLLFVAAAGNSSSDNDKKPQYPGSYDAPNIIAVAATDHQDQLASFSSYGAETVHLAAPGADILSTIPGGAYAKFSGTSMATPHVVGVAALIASYFKDIDHLAIKNRILAGVEPLAHLKDKVKTAGRLNAVKTLETDSLPPAPVKDLRIVGSDLASITVEWTASGDDGANGTAARYQLRYAEKPIATKVDWDNAKPALIEIKPKKAGDKELFTLHGLAFNSSYHLALKVIDNANNTSELSNSTQGKTKEVSVLFNDDMENASQNWTVNGEWAVTEEKAKSGSKAWSDSPGGYYKNNSEFSISSKVFEVDAGRTVLVSFNHFYDLELRYDWAIFDISTDGGKTWKTIERFTGRAKDWEQFQVDVTRLITEKSGLVMRFIVLADRSMSKDGWYIDDVKVITSKD